MNNRRNIYITLILIVLFFGKLLAIDIYNGAVKKGVITSSGNIMTFDALTNNFGFLNGRVGIGALTAPAAYKLYTVGATGVTGLLNVSGNMTAAGTITFPALTNGVLSVNGSGVLSAGSIGVTSGGTGTTTQFTQGSVVFAGASGVYSQNNSGLFWDNTNSSLGIGTTSPAAMLHVKGAATGGSGDFTNMVSNLKIEASSGYARMAVLSADSVVSLVTNYQTGKEVYWGESTDTGKYRFRGRTFVIENSSLGVGTTTPSSLFSVGSTSQFQVNSSGAIVAATGITSSGTITFSGLSNGILSASSGVITAGTAGVTAGGTGTTTQFTPGSVVFAGTSGVYSQNNSGLFWDNTNSRLGIGMITPGSKLSVSGNISVGVLYAGTASPANGAIIQGIVGIGTSTPGSSYALRVGGAAGVSGLLNVSGNITSAGTISGTYSGSGANLTNLNASNITSGTLAVANGGTGTSTAFTKGSIVFAGASGIYSQNNSGLFWDNTNSRLGIGTTTPSYVLDLTSNPTTGLVSIKNTNVSGWASVEFRDSSSTMRGGFGYANASASYHPGSMYFDSYAPLHIIANNTNPIQFFIGANEKIRIDTNGYLGIGKTNPSYVLDVVGTANATTFVGIGTGLTALNATNLTSGTVASARISGSYTGITGLGTVTTGTWSGTTIAANKGGTGQTSYTVGDMLWASSTTALSTYGANTTATKKFLNQTSSAAPTWSVVTKSDIGLSNVENTALSTWTGSTSLTTVAPTLNVTTGLSVGTSVLFVNGGSRRVGIGNTNPAEWLRIGDGLNTTKLLYFNLERAWSFSGGGSGSTTRLELAPDVDGKSFQIKTQNGGIVVDFYANNTNSQVGIGIAGPSNKLDVNGAMVVGSGYAGSITAPTDGLLVKGRMGIGTTTPAAAYGLHVAGATGVTGLLNVSGNMTAAGTITFSGLTNGILSVNGSGVVSAGAIGVTSGGTGQTSYTVGDMLWASSTTALSKYGANTTATKKFLNQTSSAAPTWSVVTKSDIGLSNVENTALSTWTGSTSLTTVAPTLNVTTGFSVNSNTLFVNGGARRVGIGTTTPADKLHVEGAVYLGNISAPSPATNRLYSISGSLYWNGSVLGGGSQWVTNGSNIGYTAGNVGIGTTSPSAGLDITNSSSGLLVRAGNINTSFANNQILFGFAGTATYQHAIKTRHDSGSLVGNAMDFYLWKYGSDVAGAVGTQYVMSLSGNGFVGIGTKSPGFLLNFPSALGDKISLWGNSGAHYGFGIQNNLLQVHTDSINGDIAFGYGSSGSFTETVRFTGDGFVGIGKTNPTVALDVNGNIAASALLVNGATQYYRDTNAGSDITQQMGMRGSNTGSGSGRFGIDFNTGGSDVGLNFGVINSGGANNIRHSAIVAGADTTTAGSESGHISFFTKPTGSALTERMRLDPSGRLGIGTTTPAAAYGLHVAGATGVTGLLNVSGNMTAAGTITFSGLTNGILSVNGRGVVSTGTIGVSSGGTGATSFTAGKLLIGNGTSAVTTTTNLHWDTTNGRLGLWTTSPGSKLDVKATSGSGISEIVARFLPKNVGALYDYTGIQVGNSYIVTPYMGSDGVGNMWDMAFYINGTSNGGFKERMRLTNKGKLGINTSSPANMITVSGNMSVGAGYIGTNAPTNGLIVQGRVGIGTTTPAGALHVKDTGGSNDVAALTIEDSGEHADYVRFVNSGSSYWVTNFIKADAGMEWNSPTAYAGFTFSGGFYYSSDKRLKKDIVELEPVLDKVMQLKPTTFRLRSEPDTATKSIGFIAQDVQPVFPELITESRPSKNGETTLGIKYGELSTIAIKAIQELKKENAELKARLERLEKLLEKR